MKYLYIFCLIIAFIFALIFGIKGKNKTCFIMSMLVVVFIFIINIDKIDFIKFFNFEARVSKIAEETTIKTLEKLSGDLGIIALDTMAAGGRFSYQLPIKYQEKVRDEIIISLEKLGKSEDEINKLINESMWKRLIVLDYIGKIIGSIDNSKAIKESIEIKDIKYDLNNLKGKLFQSEDDYLVLVGNLKTIIEKYNIIIIEPEIKELLIDLDYFIKNNKYRRPELYN